MPSVPEDGPEFEAMMREIDAAFIKRGVKIAARPLSVSREITLKYGVEFPAFRPRPNSPPELRRYARVYDKVHDWYERTYGNRLNIDMSPGRVVVDVDGDFYGLRFPRIWGTVEFVSSRRFFTPKLSRTERFRSNILQLVDDMTEPRASLMSTSAFDAIFDTFPIGLKALAVVEASVPDEPLLRKVLSDLETAVDKLMGQGEHYGESKWASLQATEKTIKSAINLAGSKFRHGHTLQDCIEQLENAGVRLPSPSLADAIQCLGGIRYDKDTCTRLEALEAHHASLRMIYDVIHAGPGFTIDMTIRKLGIGTYEVSNVASRPPSRRSPKTS